MHLNTDYQLVLPDDTDMTRLHGLLLGVVGPRPIAFASTVDAHGNVNLAPFSFFNVFSTKPPLLIFSPNRSGRTGQQKDTVLNLHEVPEVVINVVNFSMVEQQNVASAEFPRGVDEFAKAGFTPLPSVQVRPPRVAQSPAQLECKVQQIIELGKSGGSGNLVLCEVVALHIHQTVLDPHGRPDPAKLDLVARMGGNWYARAQAPNLFEVAKPVGKVLVGVDALPERIRYSKVLTGNDLGKLANVESLPTNDEIAAYASAQTTGFASIEEVHVKVQRLLAAPETVAEARLLALATDILFA